VRFNFSGSHLDKKDTFGKSDPFLVIHRQDKDGKSFTPVHKTEVIKHTLDPTWKPFDLSLSRLCNGNPDLKLFIECFDWDSNGKNDLIGSCYTTYREMSQKKEYELIEPYIQMKKGAKYKNSGILHLNSIQEIITPSFLDYLAGGTEISLVVGIDYTGSNGNPIEPHSLHYQNPNGAPNQYMQAIRTVGDIVAYYDLDKWFPAFGFGAKFNSNGQVSFCFNVNAQQNPNCPGIDGILQAYRSSFGWLTLYGPTNFEPIIESVMSLAAQVRNGEKYYILLLITDGEISDLDNTIACLRKAAQLPMSIIIVGVGSADFTNMEKLDDDDGKLGLKRDLVQFVPFRDYLNVPIAKLAKDTLAEIPGQLLNYMKQNSLSPKPKPSPPPIQL